MREGQGTKVVGDFSGMGLLVIPESMQEFMELHHEITYNFDDNFLSEEYINTYKSSETGSFKLTI